MIMETDRLGFRRDVRRLCRSPGSLSTSRTNLFESHKATPLSLLGRYRAAAGEEGQAFIFVTMRIGSAYTSIRVIFPFQFKYLLPITPFV